MKHPIPTLGGTVLLLAAGIAAAVALTMPSAASAWAPNDLPPGWTIEHITAVGATICPYSDRIWAAGRRVFSDPFCEDSPTFQQDFDAWVNAHYTAPPTTSTAPTTAPPVTDTTPAAPQPPVGQPAPGDTTTASTDTTATVTVTVTTTDQTLSDRIDQLAAQLQALTSRVARVEKAGDAAWLAFLNATSGGLTPAAAAELARGTYLNAVYGLGAFAP